MRQRLLNHYEELTFSALREACEANGARVFPKVRIADVFRLQRSGVSTEQFSYGLRAHFDFLVTDKDYEPLFSVEFDGPLHKSSSIQRARDKLKNSLCENFSHGLLRLNSNYLTRKFRGMDLLSYFVDAWFLSDAFFKAQEQGIVPYDEPFDLAFIDPTWNETDRRWPYWLSLDVQLALQRHHKEGRIGQMVPSHFVGLDEDENYRCLSWMVYDKTTVIYAVTGMRAQHFPGVMVADLVSMLAMFDIYEKLKSVQSGTHGLLFDRETFFQTKLPYFELRYRMVCSGSCGATV